MKELAGKLEVMELNGRVWNLDVTKYGLYESRDVTRAFQQRDS